MLSYITSQSTVTCCSSVVQPNLIQQVTLCNTLFGRGFQVLSLNCLCLKSMEKTTTFSKYFDFMISAQQHFVFMPTKQGHVYELLSFIRSDKKKQHLNAK